MFDSRVCMINYIKYRVLATQKWMYHNYSFGDTLTQFLPGRNVLVWFGLIQYSAFSAAKAM